MGINMNEILFYKIFDIVCTMVEMVVLILFISTFTGEKFCSKNNLKIGSCQAVLTVAATYLIPVTAFKSVFLALLFGMIWSFFKKENYVKGIAIAGLSLGMLCSIQTMVNFIESFFWNNPGFNMGKFYLGHWKWSSIMQMACLILSILLYFMLRGFHFKWEVKDLILAGSTGFTEIIIAAVSTEKLLKEGVEDKSGLFFSTCLSLVIIFLIIHFQQISQLRAKEEKERMRLQSLELEVSYFRSKAQEEQKVRKIYHDMKNLMLAAKLDMENSSLLDSVEQDLEEYGHFYESGNGVLNVILKEKRKAAKDRKIDMQIDVDFTEGNFIEDRDIVIIFGNALDNAIEACDKLSAQEGLITVKAGRIRKMLTIVFENNLAEEEVLPLSTSKSDGFLHGFGITNIKESVERYDGTCTIETKEQQFIMQILIPVP